MTEDTDDDVTMRLRFYGAGDYATYWQIQKAADIIQRFNPSAPPDDVNGVLETLARVGIGEVETAGYADRDPADFAAVLDTLGLTTPSAHQLVSEVVASSESMANAGLPDFETALETIATVGHDYFVIPWLPPDARPDRDGYLRLADLLNGFGERAKAAGVQLAYHNHDFEFDTFGTDRPAYFDFVERLDPELLADLPGFVRPVRVEDPSRCSVALVLDQALVGLVAGERMQGEAALVPVADDPDAPDIQQFLAIAVEVRMLGLMVTRQRRMARAVDTLIAPAQSAGRLRADITADDLLGTVYALCYARPPEPGWKDGVLRLLDIFVDGLHTGKPR